MLYIAYIMSFVWRSSAQGTNPLGNLSKEGLLVIRIAVTFVLGLGMLCGWLILSTFSQYTQLTLQRTKQGFQGDDSKIIRHALRTASFDGLSTKEFPVCTLSSSSLFYFCNTLNAKPPMLLLHFIKYFYQCSSYLDNQLLPLICLKVGNHFQPTCFVHGALNFGM